MYPLKVMMVLMVYIECTESGKSYLADMEKVEVVILNHSLVENLTYSYKKFNRTSPYILNIDYDLTSPWDRNVTMHVQAFEWTGNQYKSSIINHDINFCDSLSKDKIIMDIARHFSNLPKKCPAVGHFRVTNLVLVQGFLPPVLPIGRFLVDFKFIYHELKLDIMVYKIYLNIKEVYRKKKTKPK